MKQIACIAVIAVAMSVVFPQDAGVRAQAKSSPGAPAYLGFDRNDYPGDENLELLRQTFSYAGFWLNRPPGEEANPWAGKRRALESAGFGFLVLFNGTLRRSENGLARRQARQIRCPGGHCSRTARGFSRGDGNLSRSGRRRPDAAGTESLYLCLGG